MLGAERGSRGVSQAWIPGWISGTAGARSGAEAGEVGREEAWTLPKSPTSPLGNSVTLCHRAWSRGSRVSGSLSLRCEPYPSKELETASSL